MSFTVSLMFFLVSAQLVIFTSGEIFSDRATFRFSRTGGGETVKVREMVRERERDRRERRYNGTKRMCGKGRKRRTT